MKALSVAMAIVLGVIVAAAGCQSTYDIPTLVERDGLLYEVDTGNLFTGVAVKYWPSGWKMQQAELRDGKLHGKTINWHENGQKRSEFEFRDVEPISYKGWNWDGTPR